MNRNRKKGSDSDRDSVVSGKGKARKGALVDVSEWPAESESSTRKVGSSNTSSIRSYRMDCDDEKDVHPKKFGTTKTSSIRSYRMDDDDDDDDDDDEKDEPPKKFGTTKTSSIRSYRMDDDDEKDVHPKKFGTTKTGSIRSYRMDDDDDEKDVPRMKFGISRASSIRSYRISDDEKDVPPRKFGGSKASSIRSYRMDDDEKDVLPKKIGSSRASSVRSYRMDDDNDKEVSIGVTDDQYSRNSMLRSGYNVFQSDQYAALRIADTPRIKSDQGTSYVPTPVRIADTQLNSRSSTSGNDDLNTDPYVALKIAGGLRTSADLGEEIIYDSNGSSGTEEDVDVSDNSNYEQGGVEDSAEMGGESGSEEVDDEFPTGNARVSVVGSESEQGKDNGFTPGYARVSVPRIVGDYGKNVVRESPGYARVSVAGSESDHAKDRDEELQGYTKVSVPASDIVHGKGANSNGSRAGSEANYGKDTYPKVSVAGMETYHGQDVYARLSVAGSAAGHARGVERDTTGYDRVSSAGSEVDHGKNVYARIYVAGSEAKYRNDFGRDVSGLERLTVAQNAVDHVAVDMASSGSEGLKHKMGHLSKKELKLSVSDTQDRDEEPGDNEYAAYLKLSPEFQAKLQYRVRVVLISALFELKKRRLSAFFELYRSKFGVDDGLLSLSSEASLYRAMSGVIQRKQLEDNEELILVDSSKNRRAVSGIRSGLRRIVYDALKSMQRELTSSEFEEKCSELLGKPLGEVLSEHGYVTPTVESMIEDMPDIACFKEAGLESGVYLCTGAEDPALTDGLLVKSAAVVSVNAAKAPEHKGVISEVEDTWEVAKEPGPLEFQRESLKIGSSVTLRSLKKEFGRAESFCLPVVSSLEDEFFQVRLRMRILLAFCNSGRGVEGRDLHDLYAKTFGRSLILQDLGFTSIMELARHWQDIFLLQEQKPGWVFLVPSQANRRILNTLRTGLRSSVFSVLVENYPDGLDPLDFLHRLQEGMAGELWEVLDATGYICSDVEKADSMLSSSSSSDFQLVDFEEICVLLDDMMDFVRLGSNEDGSVVVKLRNGEVPLVDLLDCKLNETDMGSFDELFVNLMMIAVDVTETSEADGPLSGHDGFISVGHVQSIVKSFEGSGGLRSVHSQATDSLRLKHELRLILGCPEYCENGVALNELSNMYRNRTGQELGSKSKVKSLLRSMPDIVSKDSLVGDFVHLCKTPKNLRILSTTKAGLRQVLFWALVKNPGGIWATLLEGWFMDFSGVSLAATLQMHGYEMSKSKPFFPVHVFLRDMSDLLQKKSAPLEIYTWAGEVKDPIHHDANFLGLSELLIQYDPLSFKLEISSKTEGERVDEIVDKSALMEDEGGREIDLVNDSVLESVPSKENNGNTKASWEEEPAFNTTMKEDESNRESSLDPQHVDKSSVKRERREDKQHVDFESGDESGNGEIEGPAGPKGTVESKEDFGRYLDASLNEDTCEEQHTGGEDDPLTGENEGAAEDDDSYIPQIDEGVKNIEGDQLTSTSEAYTQLRVTHPNRDGEDGHGSGENEEAVEEDESHLPQTDEGGLKVEEDQLMSTSEAYAQLRVAGKGPKVNLDEWQFTDSEDGEDDEVNDSENDYEEEEEDEDEEEEEEEHSETTNSIKVPVQTLPPVPYVGPKIREAGKDASRPWVLPNKGLPWK